MVKLRKKKPYTCRFMTCGKACAEVLLESEGVYCSVHQNAMDKFNAGIKKSDVAAANVAVRRIWP